MSVSFFCESHLVVRTFASLFKVPRHLSAKWSVLTFSWSSKATSCQTSVKRAIQSNCLDTFPSEQSSPHPNIAGLVSAGVVWWAPCKLCDFVARVPRQWVPTTTWLPRDDPHSHNCSPALMVSALKTQLWPLIGQDGTRDLNTGLWLAGALQKF